MTLEIFSCLKCKKTYIKKFSFGIPSVGMLLFNSTLTTFCIYDVARVATLRRTLPDLLCKLTLNSSIDKIRNKSDD